MNFWKAALIYNTFNTQAQREINVFGGPLETIWKNCIFGLCGINNFDRRMFNVIVTSTGKQRKRWLESVTNDINKLFPKIR